MSPLVVQQLRAGAGTLAALVVLVLPLLMTGAAQAEPGGAEPAPTADVNLDWATLGLEPEIYLSPNATSTFTVQVPEGLSAARLRGTINAPMNVNAGYLEIDTADGDLLATVDLPPPTQPATPLDVDISAAPVLSSAVELAITLRTLDTADRFCGPLQQVMLSDLSTVFAGTAAPADTIATFFPPVLQRVAIFTPEDADAGEQQAALTLVSTLTRLYHPQPVAITVDSVRRGLPPPPAGDLARAILVEAGDTAGMSVENAGTPGAYLRVAGTGDELTTQVSLLVNQLQTLVQTAATRVDQAGAEPELSGDTLTFSQLNISGSTEVVRTASLSVGADRSALGPGRISAVAVHLLADYTPVPGDDVATVLIRSNGIVVYRAALDSSGRLDATFDVDGPAFGQWLNLDFALTYTPNVVCGPLIAPVTFQVDPRSTLTMTRGGPPLGGFGALPSEFSPAFLVAFDGSGPDQLRYAARVVAAIARLTTAPLTPQVVDVATAADADTGALIVAASDAIAQTSLNPPILAADAGVDIGLPTELRASIDGGLASIQAFADGQHNRTVILVTTTGEWSLVDPLLDRISRADAGWSSLTGDVLAAGPSGIPTNVSIRDVAPVYQAAATPQSGTDPKILWGVGAVVVVVAAAIAAIVWTRGRRAD